jgi:hypothetical protein
MERHFIHSISHEGLAREADQRAEPVHMEARGVSEPYIGQEDPLYVVVARPRQGRDLTERSAILCNTERFRAEPRGSCLGSHGY